MTDDRKNGKRPATAGLAFESYRDLDIVEIANQVANCLDSLGHRATGTRILSDTRACLRAGEHEIRLEIREDVALDALSAPAASYLSVSIVTTAPAAASVFARDSIIAQTLLALHRALAPDYIKWVDTDALVSGADFARVAHPALPAPHPGKVRPRRPDSAATRTTPRPRPMTVAARSLPDIEVTNARLQQRLTQSGPVMFSGQSDPEHLREILTENTTGSLPDAGAGEDIETAAPRRLSAWLMSIAVAVYALPVGLPLLIINLVKGENLHLSAQTAALTGTFIALNASGSMAQAMGVVDKLLG